MKNFLYLVIFLCAYSLHVAGADHTIYLLDFRYLNKYDLHDSAKVRSIWDLLHAAATLQGVVNRESPRLYIRYVENERGQNVDDYWWNKYRQPGEWLTDRDTVVLSGLPEALRIFRREIDGVVVYDPAVSSTSNVASSVAGVENLVAVRYDSSPSSLYTQIVAEGLQLPVRCWLVNPDGSSMFTGKGTIPDIGKASTGSVKIDPYVWFMEKYLKAGRCNTEYAAYYIDQYWRKAPLRTVSNHHQLTNHDFFVSKKAFFFDLSPWADEPATDDPGQRVGLDCEMLKSMLLEAYQQNGGKKFCYIGGFPSWAFKYTKHAQGRHDDVPTEWEFSRIISAYNAFKDADAIGLGALANASFWQHFPLKKRYPQRWVTHEELKERGYLNEDGTVRLDGREFVIFYVGDYDASAWTAQTTPYLWDHPDRGKVPMMWAISPVLAERVPMVMHNYRMTASENDYFVAADNGAGYLLPGMLQQPRAVSGLPSGLEAWSRHCRTYYRRWGLSVTGFVIDGEAPGLSEEGLECYRRFSPNGIVPQKVPLTLLYKDMPVLRSDYDITSPHPDEAARVMMDRISRRSVPFHWFRAILKSPSWYKEVSDELHRQNPKIEWLDAPTFFELYRLYLQQNEAAAKGEIQMK